MDNEVTGLVTFPYYEVPTPCEHTYYPSLIPLDFEPLPRRFKLVRDVDATGVSGIGTVAWGIEFFDGKVALRWDTSTASTACYDSIEDVEAIHGHDGDTRVVWVD